MLWSPGVVVVARARCLGDVIGRRRVIRKRLAPRYDDEADAETGEEGPAGGVFGRLFDHEPEGDLAAAAHAAGGAAKAGGEHHTGAAAALESAPDEAALRNEARADGRGISSRVRDRGPPRARSVYLAGRRRRSRAWRGRDDATSPAVAKRAARSTNTTRDRSARDVDHDHTSSKSNPRPPSPTHTHTTTYTNDPPPRPIENARRRPSLHQPYRTPRALNSPLPPRPPDRARRTTATARHGDEVRRVILDEAFESVQVSARSRLARGEPLLAARVWPLRAQACVVRARGACGSRRGNPSFSCSARQPTILVLGETTHHCLFGETQPTVLQRDAPSLRA